MSSEYLVHIPKDDTLIIMNYYIYDMERDHDLVKDNVSKLAKLTFGKGWDSIARKTYRVGSGGRETRDNEIRSMMTDICKQTFGKCDPDNGLFSFRNEYDIRVYCKDIEFRLGNYKEKPVTICHYEIVLSTPLTKLVKQKQGCDADHCFVASFSYREDPQYIKSGEIEVLECRLRYEGLRQLDPELCTYHHIKSVPRGSSLLQFRGSHG